MRPGAVRGLDGVSIHASREGRDDARVGKPSKDKVSIHASREGRDKDTFL